MWRNVFLTGIALAASNVAYAGGFEPKTQLDPINPHKVNRWLVLGKGWFEINLQNDFKQASGFWDDQGNAQDFESAKWTYTTQSVTINYGVSRRTELGWRFKTHYVDLQNPDLGTDLQQFGFGDPEMFYKYELYRSMSPMTSVIMYSRYKAPLANESPGNYVGGPNTFSAVILTTGTSDWEFGTRAKKQYGPMALTVGFGYVIRFSGLALYAIETELNQFMMRVNPGNITKSDATAELQLGPVNIATGVRYQMRAPFAVGNTAEGLVPSRNLKPVIGSDGWSLDNISTLTLNLTNRIDLTAQVLVPTRGEDFQFFPLEDVHPTNGNIYTGSFAFRF